MSTVRIEMTLTSLGPRLFLGPWFQVASIVGVLNELDSPLPWYQFMNCSVSFAETAAWTTCTVSLGLMRQPTIGSIAMTCVFSRCGCAGLRLGPMLTITRSTSRGNMSCAVVAPTTRSVRTAERIVPSVC